MLLRHCLLSETVNGFNCPVFDVVVYTHEACNPSYIMLDVCLCLLQVCVLSELAEQVFGAGIPFMYGTDTHKQRKKKENK